MSARGAAFQPKGERAQWVSLYEYARALPFGTLISYEKLAELVGMDVRLMGGRSVIYQAKRHLQKDALRSLACVPKMGYRIPFPDEHPDLAIHHRRKSGRQVTKALREVRSADREFASSETKGRLDFLDESYKRLSAWSRRAEKRIHVLEKTTAKKSDHDAMTERLVLLRKGRREFQGYEDRSRAMSHAYRRAPDPVERLRTHARRILSRLNIYTFAEYQAAKLSRRAVYMVTGCGPVTLAEIATWAYEHNLPLREEPGLACFHCKGSGRLRAV